MVIFFDREGEKSAFVRENRDLLIDVHRFLAWRLHSEAETGANRGGVSFEKLGKMLNAYLSKEGRDPVVLEPLFAGVLERVVALVSRVQGTYEFEVQPVREYFAARHLYDTAPYSPPGGEQGGTKPDRFDALARDFYWLNVTRFFAGCFSKGELADLGERLLVLANEEGYRLTSYPRILMGMLLADWVFEQRPTTMERIITALLADLGSAHALNAERSYGATPSALILPERCGRHELVKRCLDVLGGHPQPD
jgi:hypothetical protein